LRAGRWVLLPGLLLLLQLASAAAQTPAGRTLGPPPAPGFDSSSLATPGFAAAPVASIAPEAAPQDQHSAEAYPTNRYLAPWSRVGIGVGLSPLGIGVNAAANVNTYMDLRLNGNYFSFNPGRIEVDGFNVYPDLRLDSAAAMLDVYPFDSVWRLSAGIMFLNGNQISGSTVVAGGTSFTIDGQTFYSAKPDAATGATPITGSGVFGLHDRRPALIVSGGFGNFVIHRAFPHWSFPAEFGVIFTGAPTIDVNMSGWACKDAAETQCSDLSDDTNPVTIDFNNALNAQLNKWRRSFQSFPVYPVFSYGVVYSFGIR
jgi:hypothetical protein